MNYLGNKTKLNDFIYGVIKDYINENDKFDTNLSFFDLFTGTSSVARYWKEKGHKVSANDIQFYSYCQANSKLNNSKVRKIVVENIINNINNSNNGKIGFISKNYSPNNKNDRMFFTLKNAKKIDYAISLIKEKFESNEINEQEKFYLISKLVDSASKVSNTAVVFEAYLKEFKSTALKDMILKNDIDDIRIKGNSKIYNERIEDLILKVSGDILYLDPPYNSRGYDSNYHLLETISLGDEPQIRNKSGRRDEDEKKSNFAMKTTALASMTELLIQAKFKYIFISYNDEGIITKEQMIKIFENNNWDYKIYTKKYRRFKSNLNDGPKFVEEIVYAIKK